MAGKFTGIITGPRERNQFSLFSLNESQPRVGARKEQYRINLSVRLFAMDTNMDPTINASTQSTYYLSTISKFNTSLSNFSVQYNFQSIAIALLIMSRSVCTASETECRHGEQDDWVESTASAMVFAGAIFGQLTMGYAGDVIGRTEALFLTLSLATIATVASALAPQGSPTSVYTIIIVCRFILGVGLGGVYPLSSTKAAEASSSSTGRVNSVDSAKSFFWQAPGAMMPWMLAYYISFLDLSVNFKWRFLLGFGAVPGILVVIGTLLEFRFSSIKVELLKSDIDSKLPIKRQVVNFWLALQDPANIRVSTS